MTPSLEGQPTKAKEAKQKKRKGIIELKIGLNRVGGGGGDFLPFIKKVSLFHKKGTLLP